MEVVLEERDVFDTEDLRRRAYAAYYRWKGAKPLDGDSYSEVVRMDNKVYVSVFAPEKKKIVSIYRVDSFDGHLRRMRRPPRELIERYEGT